MRKLATIRKILDIQPIDGADSIVRVTVDGWHCVALKSEFNIGDLCVYFEIDSWIPRMPQVEQLYARASKTLNGKEGVRIKTIRLKGQISQGLALPISKFIELFDGSKFDEGQELTEYFCVGNDVSDLIGVVKYEPPVPVELGGQVEGRFPLFLSKTDQERAQNIPYRIFNENKDTEYEITMKLDGTSFTGFNNCADQGVCSRNWQIKINEYNANNTYVKIFTESNMDTALTAYGKNIAIQAELMGPSIQGNREKLLSHTLFVFDIFDIDTQMYVLPNERRAILDDLYKLGMCKDRVQHVPIFSNGASLSDLGITTIDELLLDADGPSLSHKVREGKVYKSMNSQFSFKVISNDFLIKNKD